MASLDSSRMLLKGVRRRANTANKPRVPGAPSFAVFKVGISKQLRPAPYHSSATGFLSVPTPCTVTSTTSPACSGPTPLGVPLQAGDVVEVTVQGVGTLRNPVADE